MTGINERVTIVDKDGISIIGKTLNTTGKLGNYEVHSDYWGWDNKVYQQYPEAENRFNDLKRLHEKKEKEKYQRS